MTLLYLEYKYKKLLKIGLYATSLSHQTIVVNILDDYFLFDGPYFT